jgi:hypothetical protein
MIPKSLLRRPSRRACRGKFFPLNGSDLASGGTGVSKAVFKAVLGIERGLLRLTPMPMGLSLFIVARKGKSGDGGRSGHS